eukprot:Nk52_evm53s223 gene=Nk52_evmTU53s223
MVTMGRGAGVGEEGDDLGLEGYEEGDSDRMSSLSSSSDEEETEKDVAHGGGGEGGMDGEGEEKLWGTIEVLQQRVRQNESDYDAHLELIGLLRKVEDDELLLHAREKMRAVFPLTEDIWLVWLGDERRELEKEIRKSSGKGLDSIQEQKIKRLISLHEYAVRDYISCKLWVSYAEFLIYVCETGKNQDIVDKQMICEVFDRGIQAVGLWLYGGERIWEYYHEYLITVYKSSSKDEVAKGVLNEVLLLLRRRLQLPHSGIDDTWQSLEEYLKMLKTCKDGFVPESAIDTDNLVKGLQVYYEKSKSGFEARRVFEDRIAKAKSTSNAEELERAFKEYIDFEKKSKLLNRAFCLYERWLRDCPLDVNTWKLYLGERLSYMGTGNYVSCSSGILACQQAVRNCPWSGELWILKLEALEMCSYGVSGPLSISLYGSQVERIEHHHIVEVFERAVGTGLAAADDFRKLWMAFLEYLRRRMFRLAGLENSCESRVTPEISKALASNSEELRNAFERAWIFVTQYNTDPFCEVALFKARIEYTLLANPENGRAVFETLIKNGFGKSGYIWNAYCVLEREEGDIKVCRAVFKRACQYAMDGLEMIAENWMNFERDNGSLDTFRIARERLSKKQNLLLSKNAKTLDNQNPHKKRKAAEALSSEKHPREKKKVKGNEDSNLHAEQNPIDEHWVEKEGKQSQTVFVSNLALSVGEADLKLFFEACMGTDVVQQIRLVKNVHGRSKGFAYVVLSDSSNAQKAIEFDRRALDGRPVFISAFHEKGQNTNIFKYPTTADLNTVFVAGLPKKELTSDMLETIFEAMGVVKEVRIVSDKRGLLRGIAYIEFENSDNASKAVEELNEKSVNLGSYECVLKVSISDPSAKLGPKRGAKVDKQIKNLLKPKPAPAPRKQMRKHLALTSRSLVPRSLAPKKANLPKADAASEKSKQSSETPQAAVNNNTNKQTKMNNDDFRKLLFQKQKHSE